MTEPASQQQPSLPLGKKLQNKVPRAVYSKLLIELFPQKDAIQLRIDNGLTIVELTKEWGLPEYTCKTMLEDLGVIHGRALKAKATESAAQAVMIVLERACKTMGVNYDELKPYLENGSKQ